MKFSSLLGLHAVFLCAGMCGICAGEESYVLNNLIIRGGKRGHTHT